MILPTSVEKRERAAALTHSSDAVPIPGNLEVVWDSPFDRLCYEVSASGMARRHTARYDALLADLIRSTGCTEEEVLTHGHKVRSVLFFAEDRLGRDGVLANLVGEQQHQYRLTPVSFAF